MSKTILSRASLASVLLLASPMAFAIDGVYSNPAAFLANVSLPSVESFENVPPRIRGYEHIATGLLDVRGYWPPGPTDPRPMIGIQNGPNTPDNGFGASAIDGTQYLSVYRVGEPQNTIRFDSSIGALSAFGFSITDVGETEGRITICTFLFLSASTGGGIQDCVTPATFPPLQANGNVQFFGITQTTPFLGVTIQITGVDDAYGIDQVYLSPTQVVPEPPIVALSILGLGAVIASVYHRSPHGRRSRLRSA